eukprot:14407360-Alexandrium_andersonii.AAC.1
MCVRKSVCVCLCACALVCVCLHALRGSVAGPPAPGTCPRPSGTESSVPGNGLPAAEARLRQRAQMEVRLQGSGNGRGPMDD